MTDIVVRHSSTVPADEWNLIRAQAETLAQSDIIPRAYFRKPANVVVAALTGRRFGWDVLTSMRNGHVIEGTWGMKPEAMLGLVRAAGHSVKGNLGDDRATVTGRRADTGDEITVIFTFDDAVIAKLCSIKDGKPHSRSSSGKPLPWEQYPVTMCWWRAVAMVCRFLFSDITLGVPSTEELGAMVSADGEVIEAELIEPEPYVPQPLSDDALAAFAKACADEELNPLDVLVEAFRDAVPEPLTDEHLPAMRDAFKRLSVKPVEEESAEASGGGCLGRRWGGRGR